MNPLTNANATKSWRQVLIALSALLVWTIFLYRETGFAMVAIWARSETFTHAFLVPPIALWLVWRQRQVIAVHTPMPSFGVLLAIASAAFVWLLGDLAAVNAVTQLAFTALLVLLVPALLGWDVTRLIIFPLGFLFFAVPIGEFLMPQLMEWTANFTVFALRLTGIPVYREGLQFVIPSGNWSVVEACSGVRYLIASVTVGALFAYLNYQSTKRRVLFVIVSLFVPIFANWLRAYLIVMLGHLSGNKLAAGVDHLIYGWIFFGIVIMIMFIIGARWSEPEQSVSTVRLHLQEGGTDITPNSGMTFFRLTGFAMALVMVMALPSFARWAIERGSISGEPHLSVPAQLSSGWRQSDGSLAVWQPAFQTPSAQANAIYTFGNQSVGLYLGYYRHQNYERKLVSSENVLVKSNDPKWVQIAQGVRDINFGGQSINVRTAELRRSQDSGQVNQQHLVVWKIYWINGALTASDMLAKAYGALYRLLGRGDDSAAIILYANKGQSDEGADVLATFLQTNADEIQSLLQHARRLSVP